MTERHRRPIFARVYARVAETSNRRGATEHRRRLLADLSGRVIELGAGSGANFAHYPASVEEVIAVEPEPYLRQQALRATTEALVDIQVLDGDAYCLHDRDVRAFPVQPLRVSPARSPHSGDRTPTWKFSAPVTRHLQRIKELSPAGGETSTQTPSSESLPPAPAGRLADRPPSPIAI